MRSVSGTRPSIWYPDTTWPGCGPSLSVLPLVRSHLGGAADTWCALDAGTGAGFPGIPLAIADRRIRWKLADRNARKVRFLETVIASLSLPNASTWRVDLGARDDTGGERFALITARAVGPPAELATRLGRHLAPEGTMILLTGAREPAAPDRASAPEVLGGGLRRTAMHRFEIPGLDRSHEVTIIRHT
ncbi:MAG: class I SAM-dependent methyltransferase, partial [Gammaproteobacteria bacterium]